MKGWSFASKVPLAVYVTIAAACVSPAHAEITYLQRSTALVASGRTADCVLTGCFATDTIQTGTASLGDYSDTLVYSAGMDTGIATARQESTLSSGGITVNSGAISNAPSLGSASSLFSVQFTLDSAENFHFFGHSSNSFQAASSAMQLTGPGVNLSAEPALIDPPGADDYDADITGVLAPGTYTFLVNVKSFGPTSDGTAFATATSELDLTPVPLPDAWVLLLSALVPLALVRSRGGSARGGSERSGIRTDVVFA